MIHIINTQGTLSNNPIVRRKQVIDLISFLRDIWNNQKYSNDIIYDYKLLRENIQFWNKELNRINERLSILNINNSQSFLPFE